MAVVGFVVVVALVIGLWLVVGGLLVVGRLLVVRRLLVVLTELVVGVVGLGRAWRAAAVGLLLLLWCISFVCAVDW